jgi:hypothetical protein
MLASVSQLRGKTDEEAVSDHIMTVALMACLATAMAATVSFSHVTHWATAPFTDSLTLYKSDPGLTP